MQNKSSQKQRPIAKKRRFRSGLLPLIQPVYSFSEPTLINCVSQDLLIVENLQHTIPKIEKKQHFLPAIVGFPQVPPPDCKELFDKYNECIREPEYYSVQHHNKCIEILENSIICEHKSK